MHRHALRSACLAAAIAISALCGASAQAAQTGQVAGTIIAVTPDQFTIQTPGKPVGVLNALTSAATRIAAQDLPYVWGGGHGQAGVASIGERGGSGYNGKRIGYDCSGAVAAVLVAAGLWPQGSGVPNDAGMISYLRKQKLIAPGAGTGPTEVTLYDNPGVHIFMNIDGRFWGTSDGAGGGDAKGGPGWLDDGAWDAASKSFRRYHFVTAALKAKTTAGYSLTFYTPDASMLIPTTGVGAKVNVTYATSKFGTMIASDVAYTSQSLAVGAVTAIGAGNTSFTVQDSNGTVQTFQVTPGSTVYQQLTGSQIAVDSVVAVTYLTTATPPSTTGGSGLAPAGDTYTATAVTVNAPPPPAPSSSGGGVGLIGR
ncbi:MAG TPA: hypothetical protein VME01_01845 [Solirubrobacteraceae bacterium]|nr:hypothetical protein [Solirubrobacteraceae bacterium]